eukprot:4104546-Alexandrium_andersonii.AAC.1
MALSNLMQSLPLIRVVLDAWSEASGLFLNMSKCVFVPLGRLTVDDARRWIATSCPGAQEFKVEGYAKYLGLMFGPGADAVYWQMAIAKM